jgi:subtilisin family serine protease
VRKGALVVAAAGNSGGRAGSLDYPGAYLQVLAVGALGNSGRPLALSARGPQVALAAPGEQVLSTAPRGHGGAGGDALVPRTGTSMAAAIVAGAAARVLAVRPGLSAQQVRTRLEQTARDVPPTGPDAATGAGALDLGAALTAVPPPREDPEPNDDTALARRTRALLPGSGAAVRTTRGRTGSWSDPRDGFRVTLRAGDTLTARLRGPEGADLDLALWRPDTPGTRRSSAFARTWLAAASLGPTASERIVTGAQATGVYTLEVQGVRGASRYTLTARRATSPER